MSIAPEVDGFLDAPSKPEVVQGRYKLPHPDTGKTKSWTRATTFTKTIEDSFGISTWTQRKIARGLAMSPALVAQVASLTEAENQELDALLDAAKDLAGGGEKSGQGTAIHAFTARIEGGAEPEVWVPAPWDQDVQAHLAAIKASPLEVQPDLIEQYVVVPEINVAGQLDRLYRWGDRLVVGDLKTGQRLDFTTIAIQLAIYSRATHIWDCATEAYRPMPAVDQDVAVVMHAPLGTATCTLHEVDIAAGWEAVQLCLAVKAWRARKDLAKPLEVDAAVDRSEWIAGRLKAIKDSGETKGIEAVRRFWPADCPPKAPWTDEQIDALDALLAQVEALDAVPFPPSDPAQPTAAEQLAEAFDAKVAQDQAAIDADPRQRPIVDDGKKATAVDAGQLRATVAAMTAEQKAVAQQWMAAGKLAGRPWAFGKDSTRRIAAVNAAAFACILHTLDSLDVADETTARRCIELAIGLDLQPAWTTGGILGSLTLAEAERLTVITDRFAAGDDELCADIGDRLAAHYAALAAAT